MILSPFYRWRCRGLMHGSDLQPLRMQLTAGAGVLLLGMAGVVRYGGKEKQPLCAGWGQK